MFGKKDKGTSAEEAKAKIGAIVDPRLGQTLEALGFVKSVEAEGDRLRLTIELPTPAWAPKAELEQKIRAALPSAEITWTSNVRRARPAAQGGQDLIPGAKNVILCASGKGGVGKSTIATNLAVALSTRGAKVGLLDADIYGPSIPTMFGTRVMPEVAPGGNRLTPVSQHGTKLMSIGFVVDPKEAMVWRGPMLNGALLQFMRDVDWGELDYLVLDLPPGTGDVQLTIAQNVKVAGAVLVSTPQDVALADVTRAKAMFDRVDIPVLGVVENMSLFVCTGCGMEHPIFDRGGARRLAESLGMGVLGEVPIEIGVRTASDRGVPVVLTAPESAAGKALFAIADRVATDLAVKGLEAERAGDRPRLRILQS